jgi:hypothetical protein
MEWLKRLQTLSWIRENFQNLKSSARSAPLRKDVSSSGIHKMAGLWGIVSEPIICESTCYEVRHLQINIPVSLELYSTCSQFKRNFLETTIYIWFQNGPSKMKKQPKHIRSSKDYILLSYRRGYFTTESSQERRTANITERTFTLT